MPKARTKVLSNSRRKSELKKAFDSAKTTEQMVKKFTSMEPFFEEKELVREFMLLAMQFDGVPEKVLFFGKKALNIMIDNENKNIHIKGFDFLIDSGTSSSSSTLPSNHASSLFISCVLVLLGKASFELKRHDECLSYLKWADRNFARLFDQHSSSPGTFVMQSLVVTQELLGKAKAIMGRKDDVVAHFRKVVEIKEKMLEKGCDEHGEAIKGVYEACVWVGDWKGALPYCLKALEIYEKHLGRESEKVAYVMRDLGVIYSALGEFEKALEQNQLCQCAVKNEAPDFADILKVENGNLLIELRRYEEAVSVLKGLVADAATERGRASACVYLAKALWNSEKLADSRKYLKMASKIIEKKGIDPVTVAITLNDMSSRYEAMNDFETAISMLRRALTVPEFPPELLSKCSERLFSLISRTGKEKEGVRYLEDMVEILKRKFAPNHFEVGYGCKRLGLAYAKLGQDELAVTLLANAKDIMDVSPGPHHLESLRTCRALSVSYWNIGRYELALDTQEQVVEGLKGMGPSEQELDLDEAIEKLNEMKKCVADTPAMVSPQSKDLCERFQNVAFPMTGIEENQIR